jgi:archaellin
MFKRLIAVLLITGCLVGIIALMGCESKTWQLSTTIMEGQGGISPSSGTFSDGDVVTLTAIPSSGWTFNHWGYNGNGSQNTITLVMNSDKIIYAYFTAIPTPTPTPTSGQQAVYSGLNSAQASMELAGGVKALSADKITISSIVFQIHSVNSDDTIDMGKTRIKYTDANIYNPNITYTFEDMATLSATQLSPSDLGQINISVAGITGANLTTYDTFTLEIIPQTGAAVTIQRTLPGQIDAVMDLH